MLAQGICKLCLLCSWGYNKCACVQEASIH